MYPVKRSVPSLESITIVRSTEICLRMCAVSFCLSFCIWALGCVAKIRAAGSKVRGCVCWLSSPCPSPTLTKWRHYEPEIILLCVRWYLSYPLSYRQVAEMVNERGLDVHHTTVFRWVQEYSPELDRRCRPQMTPTNDSWRVDETYIKAECRRGKLPHEPFLLVKGKDKYLDRAVDSDGNTLDFLLTALARRRSSETLFPQSVECSSHPITSCD